MNHDDDPSGAPVGAPISSPSPSSLPAVASDGGGGKRAYVKFAVALVRGILKRVASGETLVAICREPGMPSRNTVTTWAKERPIIGRAYAKAKAASGRMGGTGVSSYCPVTANEIYVRLAAGESLSQICRDPAMPEYSTVTLWRRNVPEFGEAVRTAREVQAERFCDRGWELAMEATPETAYLTQVRLGQLRWTAAVLSPRTHAKLKATEPEAPPEVHRYIFKHFRLEEREDGAMRVVAYAPDTETNQAVQVDAGPWGYPPGMMRKGKWYKHAQVPPPAAGTEADDDPEGWT